MAKGFINGVDFLNMQVMRYWSFPSTYSKGKKRDELSSMLYSNNYVAAMKRDGYFEMFLKDEDGNLFLRSRDPGVNGIVDKYDWVPHLHDFFEQFENGTCLLGEVYLEGKTSKGITSVLGCLQEKAVARQEKDTDKLHYYIFDILAFEGTLTYNLPMMDRVEALTKVENSITPNAFIDYAHYWDNPEDIHENWLRIISEGGEGVVLVKKDYPYDPKKRTARKTLKLKKELDENIDVFLTGRFKEATYSYTGKDIENWEYWYNRYTDKRIFGKMSERPAIGDCLDAVTRLWYHKWAGAVEVGLLRDGAIIPIGWISGITDDIRQAIVEDNAAMKFKVAELTCMEIDRSGDIPTLRHAKIVRWRDDKSYINCTWEQIL